MKKLLQILRNPFLKLAVSIAVYVLWVEWLGYQWLLTGILVIADYQLTGFINWRFWRKRKPKGKKHKLTTELLDSVIIASLLAIFVRIFLVEAYTIPTSSMEKTLLVGDYIFVSKLRYGPRLPITLIAIPFTHNRMPFTRNKNSFST